MGFSETRQNGVVMVRADGQLIVGNRHELKDLVTRRLAGGDRRFVIDFAGTGYIDSSGLGALVTMSKQVREHGGELRIAGLNDDLRALFELTKLDTLFTISDSAEQALAAF